MYNINFPDSVSDDIKYEIACLIWDISIRGNDEYDLEPYVSEFLYKLEKLAKTGGE